MDTEGVEAMREYSQDKDFNLVVVGVKAPKEELKQRLQDRYGDCFKETRLNLLEKDLAGVEQADYIINNNKELNQAKNKLNNILQKEVR